MQFFEAKQAFKNNAEYEQFADIVAILGLSRYQNTAEVSSGPLLINSLFN